MAHMIRRPVLYIELCRMHSCTCCEHMQRSNCAIVHCPTDFLRSSCLGFSAECACLRILRRKHARHGFLAQPRPQAVLGWGSKGFTTEFAVQCYPELHEAYIFALAWSVRDKTIPRMSLQIFLAPA